MTQIQAPTAQPARTHVVERNSIVVELSLIHI